MRVGWDLDGCNQGFIEGCNVIRQAQGQPLFTPGSWHFYREVEMTDEEWVEWCNNAADAGLLFQNDPFPGAVEAVARSKELGHTNIVITDRTFGTTPEVSKNLTITWLDKHYDGLIDEVHFDADKTKYNVDLMLEDKLENYDSLVAAGVDAYLIDCPWNHVFGDARKRIKSIVDYQHAIERVTDQGYADLALV